MNDKKEIQVILMTQDAVELLKKQAVWLAAFAGEMTGGCPGHQFDWDHPDTCERICNEDDPDNDPDIRCWLAYAAEQEKLPNE